MCLTLARNSPSCVPTSRHMNRKPKPNLTGSISNFHDFKLHHYLATLPFDTGSFAGIPCALFFHVRHRCHEPSAFLRRAKIIGESPCRTSHQFHCSWAYGGVRVRGFQVFSASYACEHVRWLFRVCRSTQQFADHVEDPSHAAVAGRVSRFTITVGLLRNPVVVLMGASVGHDPNLNLH